MKTGILRIAGWWRSLESGWIFWSHGLEKDCFTNEALAEQGVLADNVPLSIYA